MRSSIPVFILIFALFLSCESPDITPQYGNLSISLNNPASSPGKQSENLTPVFAKVKITNASGLVVVDKKLELLTFGASYTTESLQLPVGSYQLTEFQILDGTNNVIYASPVTGSPKANLVDLPLPIEFEITKNGSTRVVPEVLLVEEDATPEDFGYVSFGFEIVTPSTGSVTDIDGNIYHTITIGTQVWMVENLKTTHFNDGTSIMLMTDSLVWQSLQSPAYCWYDNDASMQNTAYGALYNWYAINTGKLAPDGWHVPSAAEWMILFNYVGGEEVAGKMLKSSSIDHWVWPGGVGTNSYGFNLLAAGSRANQGAFGNHRIDAFMWHSDDVVSWGGSITFFNFLDPAYYWGPFNKEMGASIRCIKD